MTRRRVEELGSDATSVSGLANASFDYVARAKLLTDGSDINRLALVSESGIARDHGERAPERQRGDDVLGEPVSEVLLVRVATEALSE